jgi:hypothetical protein
LEVVRRRLAAVDARLVAEIGERQVAGEYAASSTAQLLMQRLRIDPGEARARVAGAGELGPRRGLIGQVLPALFPRLAAALAAGRIAPAHARVVIDCVEDLPAGVQAEHGAAVEAILEQAAESLPPRGVRHLAAQVTARLDPDGRLAEAGARERRLGFELQHRRDGTWVPGGRLAPELGAALQVVLDALTAPPRSSDASQDAAQDAAPEFPPHAARGAASQAAEPNEPAVEIGDDRSPARRRHDALFEAVLRLLRSATLPSAGGAPVTLLVTTTAAELAAHAGHPGAGIATTGHGQPLPLGAVLGLGDASVVGVRLDAGGAVLSAGAEQRLASVAQRRALAARDRGCCFPGCTRPPAWCEAHHVRPWAAGGPTELDNLCLLCRYHHARFAATGWQVIMTGGVPEWIPPPWLDPDQHPRRNTAHPRPDPLTAISATIGFREHAA